MSEKRMLITDFQDCKLGLYKIYWKEGGFSFAAVGSLINGERWYKPTNCFNGEAYTNWDMVEFIELITTQEDEEKKEIERIKELSKGLFKDGARMTSFLKWLESEDQSK